MILHNNLVLVLAVLVAILIVKQFLESGYFREWRNTLEQNKTRVEQENIRFQKQLDNIIANTKQKINKASEEGYLEAFKSSTIDSIETQNQTQTQTQTQGSEYLTSYLNKTDIIKIQLFYKANCKYCANFMPTWNKIINNLPTSAKYEEIDCNKDLKKANENKITSVPTIILLVNNEKKVYMGDRSYNDIDKFFRYNGVNLVQRQFEDFNNGYSNSPEPTQPLNQHCPAVTFDKEIDLQNDTYMYQIFNSEGQYGYSTGGYNSDKLLTPYMAAYSTVDSYLSSLPDDNDPTKNSYKNINECSQLYANNIINFGLCDSDQLNSILGYQSNVSSGYKNSLVDNTDYSTNTNVVNAIKKVCGF